MSFEIYESKSHTAKKLIIKFYKPGKIYISRFTYDKYFSGAKNATLFFDKEKKIVAIKPSIEPINNSLKITSTLTMANYMNIPGFFEYYNIEPHGAFVPEWDEENKMLLIKLLVNPA